MATRMVAGGVGWDLVMAGRLLSVWLDTITVEACWPVVAAFEPGKTQSRFNLPDVLRARVHSHSREGLDCRRWREDDVIEPGSPWENG